MSGETATLIANKLAELGPLDKDLTEVDPRVKASPFHLGDQSVVSTTTDIDIALPANCEILSVSPSGASAWVQTVRIECLFEDGSVKNYFKRQTDIPFIPVRPAANGIPSVDLRGRWPTDDERQLRI